MHPGLSFSLAAFFPADSWGRRHRAAQYDLKQRITSQFAAHDHPLTGMHHPMRPLHGKQGRDGGRVAPERLRRWLCQLIVA